MSLVNALAIVIGALAVAATYLCLGTSIGFQVWALFIGWGAFFHTGGENDSVAKCAPAHIWGAVVAAMALFIIGSVAGSVLVTSIIVGVTVIVLVLGAHIPALATIPAAVYGYASTAAFTLLTGVSLTDFAALGKTTGLVIASLIFGNIFGLVSAKIAGSLTAGSE